MLLLSVICLFSTSLYCFHMSTGSTTVSFRQYYKVMTSSRFSFSSSSLKISYSLLISIVWPWPAPSFGNMKYLIPFCLRAKSKFFWKISLWIYENRDLPVITVQKKTSNCVAWKQLLCTFLREPPTQKSWHLVYMFLGRVSTKVT